jgi:peptidoglycan/xylan/chitin deacetylase (PgdA/CDA1 family)
VMVSSSSNRVGWNDICVRFLLNSVVVVAIALSSLAFLWIAPMASDTLFGVWTPACDPKTRIAQTPNTTAGLSGINDLSLLDSENWKTTSVSAFETCTGTQKIVLTFSDGPYYQPAYTYQILNDLTSQGILGTFFLSPGNSLGGGSDQKCELAKVIAQSGHVLGSQGWSMTDFATLSNEQLIEELYKTSEFLMTCAGVRPRFVMPPSGTMTSSQARLVSALGYTIVLPNIDALDKNSPGNANTIFNNIEGAFNATSPSGVASIVVKMTEAGVGFTGTLIQRLKTSFTARGYEFLRADGCFSAGNPTCFHNVNGVRHWICRNSVFPNPLFTTWNVV